MKFEEALKKLEAIVEQLEAGDLPLEEAIACYKEGQKLAELLKKQLAEAKTEIISQAEQTE